MPVAVTVVNPLDGTQKLGFTVGSGVGGYLRPYPSCMMRASMQEA